MKPCLRVTGNMTKRGEWIGRQGGGPQWGEAPQWDEGPKTNQCPLLTTTETDISPACIKYACLFSNWKILSFLTGTSLIAMQGLRISSETVEIAGKCQSLDTLVQLRISPEPYLNRPPPTPPACRPSPDSCGLVWTRSRPTAALFMLMCKIDICGSVSLAYNSTDVQRRENWLHT